MADDDVIRKHNFEVGDIVRESELIIPPSRAPWTGIVVYIQENYYELFYNMGPTEDLIAIHWFQAGYIESLPASVLCLVQKVRTKNKENP